MLPIEVMQRLAATNSRRDKEQILTDALVNGCDEFFIGMRLALDPLIVFHVAKAAEILDDDGSPGDYSFTEFLELTKLLHSRKLTGHAARDAIHAAAERCHVLSWNGFYRRIILKDLNVGVDEKTLNKVLTGLLPHHPKAQNYLIPIFKCQLAHDGEAAAHQRRFRGIKLIDVKMDGVRVLAVLDKDSDTVTLFSRNGLVIENFVEIQAALHTLLPHLPGSLVFDGELVSPQGFQHLMGLVRRKEPHPDMALMRYAVFDLIPLPEFRQAYCSRPQRERHAMLEAIHHAGLWNQTDGRVHVLPQIEVDLDTADGQAAFADFNRQAILDGYEGIMVKDPDAPYVGKRTAAWLKRKPFIDVTLEIVGFEAGDPDGKYKDTLGAVVGRGMDAGRMIQSNVAGISDDLRDEIWQNQDRYLGMLFDARADRLTLEEGTSTYSLRFPRFKGFRGRTPGEKL